MDENNVPDMRPTFEEIRKVDDNGKEYWSSRELCNAMGYSGYWKFQNVIDKAIKVACEKGMDIDDHFNLVVEMVKLGSGSFRKVEAFHLSRMACMIPLWGIMRLTILPWLIRRQSRHLPRSRHRPSTIRIQMRQKTCRKDLPWQKLLF